MPSEPFYGGLDHFWIARQLQSHEAEFRSDVGAADVEDQIVFPAHLANQGAAHTLRIKGEPVTFGFFGHRQRSLNTVKPAWSRTLNCNLEDLAEVEPRLQEICPENKSAEAAHGAQTSADKVLNSLLILSLRDDSLCQLWHLGRKHFAPRNNNKPAGRAVYRKRLIVVKVKVPV